MIGSTARCYRLALDLRAEDVARDARCSLGALWLWESSTIPASPGERLPMRVAGVLGLAIEARVRAVLSAGGRWQDLASGRTGAIPAAEWRAAAEGLAGSESNQEPQRESA